MMVRPDMPLLNQTQIRPARVTNRIEHIVRDIKIDPTHLPVATFCCFLSRGYVMNEFIR